MERIFDIRKRMDSVREIRHMTRAMHLVSAVKMRRARSQLATTLPFFDLCRATMAEIYIQSPELNHSFFSEHKKKKSQPLVVGYLIMTGDKGLAGAYNSNLIHSAENQIHRDMIDYARKGVTAVPKLFVAGKTGKDYFRKAGFNVVEDFRYPIDSPTFYRARDISDYIHDLYDEDEIDTVIAVYTRILSPVDIKPVSIKLVPISSDDLLEGVNLDAYRKTLPDPQTINMEFIPSAEKVMDYLATTYLNGMIYGALTEAFASEQTTRMTAMKDATENAEGMLTALKSRRNRARQGLITAQIGEIVGGARYLAGQPDQEPSVSEQLSEQGEDL